MTSLYHQDQVPHVILKLSLAWKGHAPSILKLPASSHEALHCGSRSPGAEFRGRYRVEPPKFPPLDHERGVAALSKRYRNLYIPADFCHVNAIWVDSLPEWDPLPLTHHVSMNIAKVIITVHAVWRMTYSGFFQMAQQWLNSTLPACAWDSCEPQQLLMRASFQEGCVTVSGSLCRLRSMRVMGPQKLLRTRRRPLWRSLQLLLQPRTRKHLASAGAPVSS